MALPKSGVCLPSFRGSITAGCSRGCPARLSFALWEPATPSGNEEHRNALFLMGFCTDQDEWRRQCSYFAGRGYCCATVDNRGMGRSEAPLGLYTVKQMALDAFELLEHLRWTPNETHLVGASMGGMIALEMLALCAPARFRSAALLVTTAGPLLRELPPLGGLTLVLKQMLHPTLDRRERGLLALEVNFTRPWLDADSGEVHPRTGEHLSNARVVARSGAKTHFGKLDDGFIPFQPWSGVFGQLAAVLTHWVSAERLEDIRGTGTPTLVVQATEDLLIRASGPKNLARMLAPRRVLVLQSGHGVNVERCAEVNEALLELFEHSSLPNSRL